MKTAVSTFVYNNSVELPIWLKYYGEQFGYENLYVIDHGTTDGSTDNLQGANRIQIPRNFFDDRQRARSANHVQQFLLEYYDWIVHTDCDEIIVPEPTMYANLAEYLQKLDKDFVSTTGLDLCHRFDHEPPIDLSQPILSQRSMVVFNSSWCKTAITRVPVQWWLGLHATPHPHVIDPNLYMFHLKHMDRDTTLKRQHTWLTDVPWGQQSLDGNLSWHARMGIEDYDRNTFVRYQALLNQLGPVPFEFKEVTNWVMQTQFLNWDNVYEQCVAPDVISLVPDRFKHIF